MRSIWKSTQKRPICLTPWIFLPQIHYRSLVVIQPLIPAVSVFFSPFRPFNLITIYLAEFKVFLNGLTDESIDRAMACFQEGLSTRKVLPSDFDTRRAQIACHSILRMTENGSTAIGTVCNIPKFWINLDALNQSSNLTTVETTMTRVFCMQGALKFHYWLLDIIPATIERTSNPDHQPKSWIDKLATDIRLSLFKGGVASFLSSNYLPNLPYPRSYTTTPKPLRYEDTKQLTSIISSTLRCWLHFPPEEESIAQLELLDILLANSSTSILFLDKIWGLYKDPFGTVFNNNWDIRRSKRKLTMALTKFKNEFALHPFAKTGSSSHVKLQDLSQLINQWMTYTGIVNSDNSEMVS
jgi:hypothetical protein